MNHEQDSKSMALRNYLVSTHRPRHGYFSHYDTIVSNSMTSDPT